MANSELGACDRDEYYAKLDHRTHAEDLEVDTMYQSFFLLEGSIFAFKMPIMIKNVALQGLVARVRLDIEKETGGTEESFAPRGYMEGGLWNPEGSFRDQMTITGYNNRKYAFIKGIFIDQSTEIYLDQELRAMNNDTRSL